MDEVDVYGTFTEAEAMKLGCVPFRIVADSLGTRSTSLEIEDKGGHDAKLASLRKF